jgi:ribosome-associated protein YbcJ (S4-like RNA binding protein)
MMILTAGIDLELSPSERIQKDMATKRKQKRGCKVMMGESVYVRGCKVMMGESVYVRGCKVMMGERVCVRGRR